MNSFHKQLTPLLACSAVALLAGCGSASDKDQINSIIKGVAASPASLCDHMADSLLARFGGIASCKAAAAKETADPTTHAQSITVTGNTAHTVIADKSGSHTVAFVKQNGTWKIGANR